MLPLTALDALLLLLWGFVVVLAAQRGVLGLIVGIAGTLLLKPLLLLAERSLLLALSGALLVGFLLMLSVRPFPRLNIRQPRWSHALGALGGVLLGSALIVSLLVSLPVGRDLNGAVQYPDRYPSVELPFAEVWQRSQLVSAGRAIVLYPLLERSGQLAPARRGIVRVLHTLFVVGQPWEEG